LLGAYGREGDSTVFKECPFGKNVYTEQLGLPATKPLPNTQDKPQPFVVIGDEAFGLHKNLLRPFPGRGLDQRKRIFNYRLSRARRYVECAFGILANNHSGFLPIETTCLLCERYNGSAVKPQHVAVTNGETVKCGAVRLNIVVWCERKNRSEPTAKIPLCVGTLRYNII